MNMKNVHTNDGMYLVLSVFMTLNIFADENETQFSQCNLYHST